MGGATLCSIGALILVLTASVTQGYHSGVSNQQNRVRCYADIAFVLDSSGSVGDDNWKIVKDFVKNFTKMLHFSEDKNQLAIISYGNEAHFHVGLTDYQNHNDPYAYINNKLDNEVPWLNENTNTAAGLQMVSDRVFTPGTGDRANFPNVVILISDGYHTMNTQDTIPLANRLKNESVHIITIGIGNEGVNNTELMKIASSSTSFYGILSFNLLNTIIDDITDNVCALTQRCMDKNVAFLLDSSGSMGASNFRKTKEFVKKFMNHVNMEGRANAVGLVSYSTTSATVARLGQIEDQGALNAIVDAVPHVNQRTNISGAIWKAMNDILLAKPVSRRSASDVMILLTDGWDNTDPALMVETARVAKAHGIRIFPVGVGDQVHMLNMMRIASEPGFYNTFIAHDHDDLVLQAMTGRGETLLDLVCMEKSRYPPPSFHVSTANAQRNMVIILDASATVGRDRFRQLCDNLATAVQSLEMDYNVAVVVQARGTASVVVNFGNLGVSSLISNLEYQGGSPNLVDAIIAGLLLQGNSDAHTQMMIMTSSGISSGTIRSEQLSLHFGLSRSSWSSYSSLLSDIKAELSRRRYSFYTVAIGASPQLDRLAYDVMGDYQQIDGFAYSLAGLSVEEGKNFTSALFAKSHLHAAEKLWECDFDAPTGTIEERMCSASNTDTMDFQLHSGSTPSRHTGPTQAFSGSNYLYIEATNKIPGQHAVLRLPHTNIDGPVCLHFMRHMYGWHIGVLQVVLFDPIGHERIVWQQYGPQGNQWLYTQVLLKPNFGDQIAIIASRAYGYSGDIAVDAMTLTRGPCDVTEQETIYLDLAKVPIFLP